MATERTKQNEVTKTEVLAQAQADLAKGQQALIDAETEYDRKVEAARIGTISTGLATAADRVDLAKLRITGLEDALVAAQLDYDRDTAQEVADLLRENVTRPAHGQRLSELQASLVEVLESITQEVEGSNAALLRARQLISPLSDESRRMLWDEYGVKVVTGFGGGVHIDGVLHESKSPARVLGRILPDAIHAAGFRKPALSNL